VPAEHLPDSGLRGPLSSLLLSRASNYPVGLPRIERQEDSDGKWADDEVSRNPEQHERIKEIILLCCVSPFVIVSNQWVNG